MNFIHSKWLNLEEESLKKVTAEIDKKKKQTGIKKQKQMMVDYFTPEDNGNQQQLSTNSMATKENDEPLT